jgi:hypothetical protein
MIFSNSTVINKTKGNGNSKKKHSGCASFMKSNSWHTHIVSEALSEFCQPLKLQVGHVLPLEK